MLRLAPDHHYRLYVREPEAAGALVFLESDSQRAGNLEIVTISQARLWTHLGLAREIAARPPAALFIPAHVLPLPQALWRTTRTVVTIHDVGYRLFPQAHPLGQRMYLDWSTAINARCASAVVTDSETTRRDVQRLYRTSAARMHVAYPGAPTLAGVDDAESQSVLVKFGVDVHRPTVLFIGTLQPRKNLRRLIEAWRLLLESGPASPVANIATDAAPLLLIAGAKGWGGEDMDSIVEARGVSDSVRCIGYISEREKAALMRGARAFAFPSLYEGFGFPVLEAQGAGVPVVCSNTSSLPEVAGDGALLVDPLDVRAIAAGLRTALYDEGGRAELIARGYRNVKRFTWDQCAGAILHLLELEQ